MSNAQRLRETISGRENGGDETYKVVDEYIEKNKLVMVGVDDAKKIAQEIREKAAETLAALNTAIKVSNATTYIDI